MKYLRRGTAFALIAASAVAIVLALSQIARIGPSSSAGPDSASPTAGGSVIPSVPESFSPSPAEGVLPEEIAERYWVASIGPLRWVIGMTDAGVIRELPDGTRVAAWRDDRLLISAGGALQIDDAVTGARLKEVALDSLIVGHAAVVGDSIYVTLISASFEDGGVWRANVGETSLVNVIPGTNLPGANDGSPAREGIYLSPSGQTLASSLCTKDGCQTQVADLATSTIRSIDDVSVAWVSDLVVVVYQDYVLRAYDLNSGARLWELSTEGVFYQGYFLTDERTLLLTSSEAPGEAFRYEIATVDALSGQRTLVASFDASPLRDMRVMPELSTDRYAVLLSAYTLDEAVSTPGTRMRILDLSTGMLLDSERAFP